jgi:hypothetical protein
VLACLLASCRPLRVTAARGRSDEEKEEVKRGYERRGKQSIGRVKLELGLAPQD